MNKCETLLSHPIIREEGTVNIPPPPPQKLFCWERKWVRMLTFTFRFSLGEEKYIYLVLSNLKITGIWSHNISITFEWWPLAVCLLVILWLYSKKKKKKECRYSGCPLSHDSVEQLSEEEGHCFVLRAVILNSSVFFIWLFRELLVSFEWLWFDLIALKDVSCEPKHVYKWLE